MLVYGDQSETVDPRQRLESIADRLESVRRMAPGPDRHAELVGALIDAGQLLQGVADAGARTDELGGFVYRLAGAVVRSWDSRFADTGDLPDLPAGKLPRWVELRLPEGFAFYAVYPEAYIKPAREVCLVGPPRVIGIRSIGTTLAAVVAAALAAPPPTTVRPFGDPFARQVELPPELIDGNAHYVIVDEGPGLSGSSFGSVADWLEARGVPLERIAFLPSHGGDPGAEANARHLERWSHAQRIPAEFDPGFLSLWFGPLTQFWTGTAGERLKYRGWRGGTRVLLKFAGLGRIGERKLQMARALHASGFTPEPLQLVHGFLVERWCENAKALDPGDQPVEEIGRYLGARARLFPAEAASGASIDELLTMCRRNISLAVGDEAVRAIGEWDVARLARAVARVATDNKLDRQEWLRTDDGRLLKTDALDHHCTHDLIGCQDIAWDVAGAIVEFDLAPNQIRRLIEATEQGSGQPIKRDLLEFYLIAYCAFRLGQAALMGHPGERYLTALHHHLQHDRLATPQDSLVG
jgi:hypothetical protein